MLPQHLDAMASSGGVPMVLDRVLTPIEQSLWNFRPFVSNFPMGFYQYHIFFKGPWTLLLHQ